MFSTLGQALCQRIHTGLHIRTQFREQEKLLTTDLSLPKP
jgi:hypothetical protein